MTVPTRGDGSSPEPGPVSRPEPDDDALAGLRDAVAALPDGAEAGDVDAAEHATRFEAVHDALVAVLADVDRT